MANNLHAAAAAALLTLITLMSMGPVLVVCNEHLWSAALPNVAVPRTLCDAVSPVEDTPIATRFASALSRGAVFPSMSAAFCDAASLICENHIEISSYGTLSSTQSRAPSIKTINDFQFDFFLETNLVAGQSLHLSTNLHDPIPARAFLPSLVAETLPPLTTDNLPKLRNAFNVQDRTEMATVMGTAAFLCENPALPGEAKACVLTLPAMAQFVVSQLGTQVQALATSGASATETSSVAKIESVTKRSLAEGDHIIICHTVMFPSALYYCHHVTGTKVVQAKIRVNSSVIDAVGICHLDTSLWASEHPAFTALNIPRGAEACHWTVQNDIVWVSAATQ
uniref:BURP domain RD22-like protein n=1 Tax=Pohlia nutans TaxID=140635 RepID=A0A4P8JIS1_9BRYO|nr:BURP domain RD22-like protein [Pohlia nutans]